MNIINELSHWELLEIEKPARYLGGEANQTKIKINPKLRVCLVFPDLYEPPLILVSVFMLKFIFSSSWEVLNSYE